MVKSRTPGSDLGGTRHLAVRVRKSKGRSASSQRWLTRQLNDPYVAAAQADGYRARSAYKLIELDDRFKILRPGQRVLDLGAAPGGWSQVALARIGDKGKLVGIDLLEIDPLPGAEFHQLDFLAEDAEQKIERWLGGGADVVLSDMAANTTGHKQTDHWRIVALAEAAHDFAARVLSPGGAFVCKVLRGGTEDSLLKRIKENFADVRHAKPPASRADSAEMYIVAKGFR
jgi:23S rRNA (uridine2552-2'-O)-methyltransferase